MVKPIDPRTDVGHVHLKVADLERALRFYSGVLGFELVQRMGNSAAFLSAGGYHHHIGLNTWESRGGTAPAPGTTGLYHFAIRYPDRASLGDALKRLNDTGIALDGASDHGVSDALYLRDPDGNGLELYYDRPREEWPRAADGSLEMRTEPLDLGALLSAAADAAQAARSGPQALDAAARERLRELRIRLLDLHKVLLDDARVAYEMDRARVETNLSLLQLVIHDPWFAWLHSLSGLIVRIDETLDPKISTPAAAADGVALLEEVDRLLTASEAGNEFARRYFEALQRQPAVVLAHAAVKRVLKTR